MKQILILVFVACGALLVSCEKNDTLPTITPSTIFSVSGLKHTKDTVNLGDSIYFTATGKIADTTNTVSAALRIVSGTVSSAGAFTSSNIVVASYYFKTVNRIITPASGTSPLYNWTATLAIPTPMVANKTNILTTASFENSLSLSSQSGTQVVNDSKQVYIK